MALKSSPWRSYQARAALIASRSKGSVLTSILDSAGALVDFVSGVGRVVSGAGAGLQDAKKRPRTSVGNMGVLIMISSSCVVSPSYSN